MLVSFGSSKGCWKSRADLRKLNNFEEEQLMTYCCRMGRGIFSSTTVYAISLLLCAVFIVCFKTQSAVAAEATCEIKDVTKYSIGEFRLYLGYTIVYRECGKYVSFQCSSSAPVREFQDGKVIYNCKIYQAPPISWLSARTTGPFSETLWVDELNSGIDDLLCSRLLTRLAPYPICK